MTLPKEEHKALILAMSLDEKGRKCLKRGDFDLALVLLLEASQEYKNCRSELLERSDNYGKNKTFLLRALAFTQERVSFAYKLNLAWHSFPINWTLIHRKFFLIPALLNLEIAWCYLHLGNMTQLPDADTRLAECEEQLHKIHGANLERVLAVKGTNAEEKAIHMRLHLLQGIVAFHQGYKDKATDLLRQVCRELDSLKISQDLIDEVKALGYTEREARLSLRAMDGDMAKAIRHAEKLRADRKRVEETNRKRRKYGNTTDGSWVNIGKVTSLMSMGFGEDYVVTALQHTNNDMNEALDLLQTQPELLVAIQESSKKDALKSAAEAAFDPSKPGPSVSSLKKKAEELKKAQEEARQRMEEEVDELGSTDKHLDLTLDREEEVLKKYLAFLKDA